MDVMKSGSNEIDIMEFRIGEVTYGINVLKVKELVEASTYTPLPNSHPHL